MFCFSKAGGDQNEPISITKRDYFIGSSVENDLVITDSGVPEIAVRLSFEEETYAAEAIRTSGAVRLNGSRLKQVRLKSGDELQVGDAVLVFGKTEQKNAGVPESGNAAEVLRHFTSFCDWVGKERDLRALLRRVMESLLEIVGGSEAFIFTLNKDGKPEVFISSTEGEVGARFSDTIVQETLRNGKGVFIPNALTDPAFSNAQSIADLKLTSVLCCPMAVAGNVIGIVYIGSKSAAASFGESHLETLKMYAQMAAMLINHVEYISQQSTVIRRLSGQSGTEGVVAQSPKMLKIISDIESISKSDITILLQGETGTGKDVMAQFAHRSSSRSSGPFVVVNCSSLRGELLESELFGHKKGSFTGAVSDHAGLFAAADGGTLFLDEIGEMDIGLQAKLLRTLETGKIRPVGSASESLANVRIICATNRDLEKMVSDGTFRQDLYYRLNQFAIRIPPIRERGDDLLHLAYFFLDKYRAQYPHKTVSEFHPDTTKALMFHEWPGNVRELASMIHKAVLLSQGPVISLEFGTTEERCVNFEEATREYQKRLLLRAIAACNGNKEKAAAMLELSRSTFFRYLSTMNVKE